MDIFSGSPANDPDFPPPSDIRAELDEMLDELDDATLLALWRFLYALLYGPHTGDGGSPG
jgi:hypothetical protein